MNNPSKKTIKAFCVLALMLYLSMISGLAMPAQAAKLVDRNTTGSLTVNPKYNGQIVNDCVFKVYQVAGLSDDPAQNYTLLAPFDAVADELDINKIATPADTEKSAAQKLLAVAGTLNGLTGNVPEKDIRTIAGGESISDLPLGLYLIVQSSAPKYYTAALPFLISLPMTNEAGGVWEYSVEALPKLGYTPPGDTPSRGPDPTPTPTPIESKPPIIHVETPNDGNPNTTPPTDKDKGKEITDDTPPLKGLIPQTGMLQWPIPILSLLGMILISCGVVIGSRKKSNEDN